MSLLNLPFLANFYKLTGMSGTYYYYYYYEVLTNLPICNLFFAILCNLFFVNIVDLFFTSIFKNFQKHFKFFFQKKNISKKFSKKYFYLIYLQLFFAIPCKIRIIPSTPCKAQLNLQNLEANLQILLILFIIKHNFIKNKIIQ